MDTPCRIDFLLDIFKLFDFCTKTAQPKDVDNGIQGTKKKKAFENLMLT